MTLPFLEYGHEKNTSEQIVKMRRSFLAIFCQHEPQLHKSYANWFTEDWKYTFLRIYVLERVKRIFR